ncbi:N-acetylmuramoyl-L-alanine amidase [Litoreibacter halocynthiae]|uniref:N-acetylmuramoyl-L-alanine amidase n=2 Tax=Litoreibacter halocynthiae TaxID=1242689 RepID=A0A4R7LJ13_9RHOB|nr:N-acetylmuramoyl-L-alanine amidase [Litoreibacter halocynthiae]
MPLKKIVMHWSAGGHNANSSDKRHYHEIVEGDGDRVGGDHLPEANNSTSDGHYAAHTRAFNTGAIGLSMAAMSGAKERPFSKGKYPITPVQLDVFVEMVAEYADTYNIDITRENVLSHAEVQITHGVKQNGKWDITWLPGMAKPGHPIEVGDHLREMIRAKQVEIFHEDAPIMAGLNMDKFSEKLASHIGEFLKSQKA